MAPEIREHGVQQDHHAEMLEWEFRETVLGHVEFGESPFRAMGGDRTQAEQHGVPLLPRRREPALDFFDDHWFHRSGFDFLQTLAAHDIARDISSLEDEHVSKYGAHTWEVSDPNSNPEPTPTPEGNEPSAKRRKE